MPPVAFDTASCTLSITLGVSNNLLSSLIWALVLGHIDCTHGLQLTLGMRFLNLVYMGKLPGCKQLEITGIALNLQSNARLHCKSNVYPGDNVAFTFYYESPVCMRLSHVHSCSPAAPSIEGCGRSYILCGE